MTLKNLLGISLDAIEPDPAFVARRLAAAQRNIVDAQLVPDPVAAECPVSARALQTHVLAWLKVNRPDLLKG